MTNQNSHIMKTNKFKLLTLLICMGGFMTIQAQGLYNLATLDDELDSDTGGISIHPALSISGMDWADEGVEWADNTIGGSVGFGWEDFDGDSSTSYCFGAEFLHKIVGEDQNPNGAGYIGAFANYHSAKSDNFDESLLKAGVKFSYFDRITALNKVQLIYGANAHYETGNRDFSGFEDDISGFGASIYTGVNIRLCGKASVGLEVPVISYLSRTFESSGSEFDQDQFRVGVNKDNMVSATLRWVLDKLNDSYLED